MLTLVRINCILEIPSVSKLLPCMADKSSSLPVLLRDAIWMSIPPYTGPFEGEIQQNALKIGAL
jgi:hypothetical protein